MFDQPEVFAARTARVSDSRGRERGFRRNGVRAAASPAPKTLSAWFRSSLDRGSTEIDLDRIRLAAKIGEVARAGADQGAGERRGEGDLAGGGIGLVVADDVDGALLAVEAEGDAAAEGGFVCRAVAAPSSAVAKRVRQ